MELAVISLVSVSCLFAGLWWGASCDAAHYMQQAEKQGDYINELLEIKRKYERIKDKIEQMAIIAEIIEPDDDD